MSVRIALQEIKPKALKLAWAYIIVCTLLVLLALPGSLWLDVRSIVVSDGIVGVAPKVHVERTIRFPFYGEWTVTVMRRAAHGYATFCFANGANDYRPENALPDDPDLNWWTYPKECSLPAGTYKVNIIWTVHTEIFPPKQVRASSNIFVIRP